MHPNLTRAAEVAAKKKEKRIEKQIFSKEKKRYGIFLRYGRSNNLTAKYPL